MNQHLAKSFEDLLTKHVLNKYVNFLSHSLGFSLDPVIFDLPEGTAAGVQEQ